MKIHFNSHKQFVHNIQGGAKGGSQCEYTKHEAYSLLLFINYRILFRINKCKPIFAPSIHMVIKNKAQSEPSNF